MAEETNDLGEQTKIAIGSTAIVLMIPVLVLFGGILWVINKFSKGFLLALIDVYIVDSFSRGLIATFAIATLVVAIGVFIYLRLCRAVKRARMK